MLKECLKCGKEFKARTRVHRYCSDKCRMTSDEYKERYKEVWAVMKDVYRKKNYKDIYCQKCDTFIGVSPPISKKRKWCDKCKREVKNQRARERGFRDEERIRVNKEFSNHEKYYKRWTQKDITKLERLYEQGVKLVDIARSLERTYGATVKKLRVIYGKEFQKNFKKSKEESKDNLGDLYKSPTSGNLLI